jgi:hypothetical protein
MDNPCVEQLREITVLSHVNRIPKHFQALRSKAIASGRLNRHATVTKSQCHDDSYNRVESVSQSQRAESMYIHLGSNHCRDSSNCHYRCVSPGVCQCHSYTLTLTVG